MRSRSFAKASGSALSATSRFSLVSRARYTSPMAPAPMGARISYGPRRVPAARGIQRLRLGFFFLLRRQFRQHAQVFQGSHIAGHGIVRHDLPQQPPHDFAAARLGKTVRKTNLRRLRKAPNLAADPFPQLFAQFFLVPVALLQRDKPPHCLPRNLARLPPPPP